MIRHGPAPFNIYEFDGFKPVIHESAFIHPNATITGNVIIGRDVYVGPGAAIRGDWGGIVIEDGCNVQENCTVHMFPGVTVLLEESAHIGHGAVIHGARIGRNSLVGMNAVVMDNVVIGAECIIGALTFVPAEMQIPARKVVVGNPAKIVKDVSDDMIEWKTEGTRLYQSLPEQLRQTLKPVDPLRMSVSYTKSRLVRNDNRVRAFDADLVSLRSTYQFSRFVFTRMRLDYDSTRNNYSGQALFGWNPNPGTAFYVGYNDNFNYNGRNPYQTFDVVPGFDRNSRTFFIRASYLFRKSF